MKCPTDASCEATATIGKPIVLVHGRDSGQAGNWIGRGSGGGWKWCARSETSSDASGSACLPGIMFVGLVVHPFGTGGAPDIFASLTM